MKKRIAKGRKRIRLVPHEIEEILPPLFEQETASDAIAYVRFFDPTGRFAFYAFEGSPTSDGDFQMHGWLRSHLGRNFDGLSYASVRELEDCPGELGLGVVRDPLFRFARLSEIQPRLFPAFSPNS